MNQLVSKAYRFARAPFVRWRIRRAQRELARLESYAREHELAAAFCDRGSDAFFELLGMACHVRGALVPAACAEIARLERML